ncbi:MAG: serine/threonine protein kinase [Acidobacteria bacterium]|nr:serine/threonine protein kinase [Acidobacteriota bacterium]MBI3428042.1 serine/threonine protein kinase [Acidobacteriota bacterium]
MQNNPQSAIRNPQSIGEYQVAELLGTGGMGEVYRAVHVKIKRVVAIKLLKNVSGPLVERSINEARIQAGLQHPNIATLYDFLEWQGKPCLILEYVDGQTLAEHLEARGRLAPAEALGIFQAVVEAVAYLHRHGIIHRDIKANNIKLSSAGAVKLLDFGIAKDGTAPQLTLAGHVIGTLVCLAPEQLQGHADARSDVWALGVLLYQMVTGRMPFAAPTLDKLYEQIKQARFDAPTTLNPAMPRELEAVIARCLKKHPADRYASAVELLSAVKDLTTPAAEARPANPAASVRAAKSASSVTPRWRSVYALAAVALALVIGAILFWPLPAPDALQIKYIAPTPAASGSTTPELWRTIQIDAVDGRAEVYQAGQRLGTTPHELRARVGESVTLELRRDGAARQVEFAVTENRKGYTYSVK